MHWHLQNAGTLLQLGYTFTKSLSQALFRGRDLITWCQDSYSLQDPFNPGAFTAMDAAPSPMVSSSFSQCQASDAVTTLPSLAARMRCSLGPY